MARPFGLLDRLIVRELAALTFATLGFTTLLYLVIDYADRAPMIGRHAFEMAALQFYANKAAVIAYQLAPAALIIGGAMLVAQLSRAGELGALLAIGTRPLRIAAPIAGFGLAMAVGVFALGEAVVVGADQRMDEITLKGFGNWGDWGRYHPETTWMRGQGGSRFYKLGRFRLGGWEPVTVLEIVAPFSLARRLDARRIEPTSTGSWRLLDAVEMRYSADPTVSGGQIARRQAPELFERFPDTVPELLLRTGRPRQMRWTELTEQTVRRASAGQPVREWELALAERASQAGLAIAGALSGFAVSLGMMGERRRLPYASSIMLGLMLTFTLWGVSTVTHAAALSGRLPPFLAGGATAFVASLLAVVALASLKA